MKNIGILNFSGRKYGNCASIVSYITNFHANANICIYNISEQIAPCGECDYECLTTGDGCPELSKIKPLMDQIMGCDLVYYIVPNYCGFPCANYFAFNERTVGYFHLNQTTMEQYMNINKKFIIVSNTEDVTFLKAMQQQSQNPRILYLKSNKYGRRSAAGDILDSEQARRDLRIFLI